MAPLRCMLLASLFVALAWTAWSEAWSEETPAAPPFPGQSFRDQPQWRTGPRLLKLGEAIEFEFYVPQGFPPGGLLIYPQYLEKAEPGDRFHARFKNGDRHLANTSSSDTGGSLARSQSPFLGDLDWLQGLAPERLNLKFVENRASVSYVPRKPGSYLAKWQTADETFYRYFAAIEDDWIVLSLSPMWALEAEPTLHATGIPLDYRLPLERFKPDDPLFRKFSEYHRRYGDTLMPHFPDTPNLATAERVKLYGEGMERVRAMLPDGKDVRSARVEMHHDLDPGYTETFLQLGVNDHCGLVEANAKPWLGMPEFPYFASPIDCRKTNQAEGGAVVAHQWDFCGGWHFLGPVSWHYKVAEGDWSQAEHCLLNGMEEFRNLAELSGHPCFAVPLYDGLAGRDYPNPSFFYDLAVSRDRQDMLRFVERYQRFMAFELPKRFRVAYARTIDIAAYYRRHFRTTPRTVFVSKTDHVMYDMWWLCNWCDKRILVPRAQIPWETRPSSVFELRDTVAPFKDPLSYEYVLIEDQKRQMRFERESPNPIWWFDYTKQERGPKGSSISYTRTPDVEVVRSPWEANDGMQTIRLKMSTKAEFPDYAVCLWRVPAPFTADRTKIDTNAQEFIPVKNTAGEFHIVLVFDLKPGTEIVVRVRQ